MLPIADQFYIAVVLRDGTKAQLNYKLENNPIAQQWFNKLKKIHRVPIDKVYSHKNEHEYNETTVNQLIIEYLEQLNKSIKLNYIYSNPISSTDCNHLHALTVATQYNYSKEVRDIFHQLHRYIHTLEKLRNPLRPWTLQISWGEKEGLLKGKFDQSPYQYYQEEFQPGDLLLPWTEFGKTPWEFWKNHDADTPEHFFETCRPHQTFRVTCNLCTRNQPLTPFDDEFAVWFSKYSEKWQKLYGIGWESLYQDRGVLLATTKSQVDFDNILEIDSIAIAPGVTV